MRKVRFGRYNLSTLTGMGTELTDVMMRQKVSITCERETKLKVAKARYIYWRSKMVVSRSSNGRDGIGIVGRHKKYMVVGMINKSDKVMIVKILIGTVILNVISAYAPQAGFQDGVKLSFCKYVGYSASPIAYSTGEAYHPR